MYIREIKSHHIYHEFGSELLPKWYIKRKNNKILFTGDYGVYIAKNNKLYTNCKQLTLFDMIRLKELTDKKLVLRGMPTNNIFKSIKTYTLELSCKEFGWVKLAEIPEENRDEWVTIVEGLNAFMSL